MLLARLLPVTGIRRLLVALAPKGGGCEALWSAWPLQQCRSTLVSKGVFIGTFSGFETDGPLHATFHAPDRKIRCFQAGEGFIRYFLAAHQKGLAVVSYHRVREYVPRAGAYETFDRIVDARIGATSYADWLKSVAWGRTQDELKETFEPVFERALKGSAGAL